MGILYAGEKKMNVNQAPSRRAKLFAKIVSVVLLLFASYCFLGVWTALVKGYIENGVGLFDILFLFIFPIPVSIFSGYCVFVAYKIFREVTAKNLRSIWFIVSVLIYITAASIPFVIYKQYNSGKTLVPWFSLIEILSMIPAGLFYFFAGRYFTKWLGFDVAIDWEKRRTTAKRFFGLMALFIYSALMLYGAKLEEAGIIDVEAFPPLIFGFLFVPPVIVFIFYKLAMRIAMHGCPKNQDQKQAAEATFPVE
jgi:hypothetical protein